MELGGKQGITKTLVYLSKHFRIICYNAHHPNMIVSLDYWQEDRTGFPGVAPSSFFASSNVAHMVIQSSHNDWFLNADLAEARAKLREFTKPYQKVTAFGFSMGGYGALLFSHALRVNQVVLVSPQYSIFASRAPFENRYLQEASVLDVSYDTLDVNPRKGLRGVVLFDPSVPQDRQHVDKITDIYPNIRRVPLTFAGHPALRAITGVDLFENVQKELVRNRFRPSEMRRLHKISRQTSPVYQDRIEAYLNKRVARSLDVQKHLSPVG